MLRRSRSMSTSSRKLLRSVREKIRIVDDWHNPPRLPALRGRVRAQSLRCADEGDPRLAQRNLCNEALQPVQKRHRERAWVPNSAQLFDFYATHTLVARRRTRPSFL